MEGRWRTLLNDDHRQCYLRYLPDAMSDTEADEAFQRTKALALWDSFSGMPRLTAWYVQKGCSCSYRYGKHEVHPQPYPSGSKT